MYEFRQQPNKLEPPRISFKDDKFSRLNFCKDVLAIFLYFCLHFFFLPCQAASNIETADKKPSKNIFPGDTSFETGVGFWMPQGGWALDQQFAKEGKQSLRLEAPFIATGVNGLLGSDGIRLKNDSDYTFSVWLKGEDESQNVKIRVMRGDWQCVMKDCKLGKDWRLFSVTIPKDRLSPEGDLWYVSFIASDRKKIWMDAVKLEKSTTATDYLPSEELALSISSGIPANIFFDTDNVKFNASLCNSGQSEKKWYLSWEVKDCVSQKNIYSGNKTITLAPFEKITEALKVFDGKIANGYYQLHVNVGLGNIISRDSYFAVVPPPRKSTNSFAGIRCEGSKPELEAMRRLGSRWVALAAGSGWNLIEAQKGEYNQARLAFVDDAVNAAHDLGMNIRLGIGGTPAWASTAPKGKREYANYPPADYAWLTDYAKFIAGRYQAKVKRWEILGESDLSWRGTQGWSDEEASTHISDFIKAAAKGIKAGAPDARVSACGISSGNAVSFLEMIYEKSYSVIDDVDIHPYPGIRNIGPRGRWVEPENNFVYENLVGLRKFLDKRNPKCGHGVGELGYTLDVSVPYDSNFAFEHAAILQRAFLLSYAADATKINWYCSYNNDEPAGYRYGIFRSGEGYQPLPAAAAYAWVASVLDSARLASRRLIANAIQSLIFSRDDQAFIVLWNYRNDKKIEMEFFSATDKLALYNMFGASLGVWNSGEKIKCEISRRPIFLKCAVKELAKLEAAIDSASFKVPPLDLEISIENDKTLKLELSNRVSIPVSGVAKISLSPGWKAVKENWDFESVPINGKSELSIPVSGQSARAQEQLQVTVEIKTNRNATLSANRTFELVRVPKMNANVKFDGAFANWPGNPIQMGKDFIRPPDILNSKIWKGDSDFSVTFQRAWDSKYLYLGFDVSDDIHYPAALAHLAYQGDSVQFAVDSRKNCMPGDTFSGKNSEFGFALINNRAESYCWLAPDSQNNNHPEEIIVFAERQSGKTIYRVAMPWDRMGLKSPVSGDVFKASFVVFDKDGPNESTRWIELSGGIAGGKKPYLFKTFVLE